MTVGDLVRQRRQFYSKHFIDEVGIIIEVVYPRVELPDYRTPTSVLVFYGEAHKEDGAMKQEIWFHKNELELINAD